MRISVISDLHLERGMHLDVAARVPRLPGGDILAICGDIMPVGLLRHAVHRESFARFFTTEVRKYEHVLVVLGNADYKGGSLRDTPGMYRKALAEVAPHSLMLDNEVTTIGGVSFVGSTLWAPYGDHRKRTLERAIQNCCYDFRSITTHVPRPNAGQYEAALDAAQGRFVMPLDLRNKHYECKEWIKQALRETRRAIVLTHHAPSVICAHPGHSDDLQAAYCGAMDKTIRESKALIAWGHGHTHHPVDFVLGGARIVSNPRGYIAQEPMCERFDASAADILPAAAQHKQAA